MATYEQRGRKWRVQTCVRGVRKSRTFDTKRDARAWAEAVEDGLQSGLLHSAFDRYRENESPKHKSYRSECLRFDRLKRELPDLPVSEITPEIMSQWRDRRLREVKPASVNRDISLLNAVFNIAMREWGWLNDNPLRAVRKPRNPPPRRRGIAQAEIDLILATNKWSGVVEYKRDQVTAAFLIAIETAMRASEVLRAEVDIDKRVAVLYETKNNDRREVPLSSMAVELYQLVGKFTISPETLSTLFRKLKHQAGLHDLRFHDTRSEGLTRLSKKLNVVQLAKVVGHRDPRSLMIYYAESAEDMARLLD